MREIKTEANNIQDAVEKGLSEIGMRRDQVEVVVVSEGTRGFLGIGAKKACVILREKKWTGAGAHDTDDSRPRPSYGGREPRRYGGGRGGGGGRSERGGERRPDYANRGNRNSERPQEPARDGNRSADYAQHSGRGEAVRPPAANLIFKEDTLPESVTSFKAPEDPVEHAKLALSRTLELLGMPATIAEASYNQAEALVSLRFDCAQTQFFTGENGRALQALQFLINSMLNKNRQQRLALRIDTGDYWKSKELEIAKRVEQAVNDIKASSQPYRLEPMPAPMRKLVHNLVKSSYPEMETMSEGEGQFRKVIIRQAAPKQEVK
ncbi:MAG: Jag N-terminal domain-containing protein [Elusimicrobia bacterium]|nr:Jag N-terminal domain-containing protein [Elusimicrobiota bacterium]